MKSTRVGPALTGGPSGKPGDAHDPRGRLDRHVHCEIVPVGAADAETGARAIDQARVERVQPGPANAEIVHRPGRKVFEQYVGVLGHPFEQSSAALVFQVQGDRVLVLVQHGKGQGRALTRLGAPTSRLAARRLDLDHEGAGFREQKARIGPLKDLAEIEHSHIRQRRIGPRLHHRLILHFC
jgi:hypothetical protein